MKKVLKIIVSIILIFILIFAGGIFYLSRGLNKDIQLTGVNISNINDGVYEGKYSGGRWTNELKITIKDKKITDIDIVDDVTFSKPSVSVELFERVKKAQNTTVDAVSEATITSRAYLKSIENAINK